MEDLYLWKIWVVEDLGQPEHAPFRELKKEADRSASFSKIQQHAWNVELAAVQRTTVTKSVPEADGPTGS